MDIFRGRPLLVGGVIFVSIGTAAWFWRSAFFYWLCIPFLILSACFCVHLSVKKRIGKYRLASCLLIALMCLILPLRCGSFYLSTYADIVSLCGTAENISCTVKSRETSSGYSSSYLVQLNRIYGRSINAESILYCSFSSAYNIGDVLSIGEAEVCEAAEVYAPYVSEGIYLYCTVEYEDSISAEGSESVGISNFFAEIKGRLSYILRTEIGGKAGQLCAAMLLGDKDHLSDSVKLDFMRSGVSHLLAVSGMHMSLAASLLSKIFKKLRISKNITLCAVALFLLCYLCVLGFPLSAVRSVVMLLVSYCGLLFGLDSDGLSALSLALWLILIISPAAIADIGFILSFCASFGILALTPLYSGLALKYTKHIRKRPSMAGKPSLLRKICDRAVLILIEYVLSPLVAVVSANMMTILPVSLFYGEFSLFSAVSNIVFPLLSLPLMTLSFCVLLFYPFGSLCRIFSYLASLCGDFMLKLSSEISDIRGVSLSLRHPYVLWVLIPALAVTLLLLALRLRHKWTVILPFVLSVCIIAGIRVFPYNAKGYICSGGQGSNDTLYVCSGDSAVIIEIGAGGYSLLKNTLDSAESLGATEVEALVLTHTHTAHLSSVYRLLGKAKTRQLWLPEPDNADEAARIYRLYEIAESFGTEVRMYRSFEKLKLFGDISMQISGAYTVSRSTQPLSVVSIDFGSGKLVYLGASSWESSDILNNIDITGDTYVITGRHGPVLKTVCSFPLNTAAAVMCREGCSYKYWFGAEENLPTRCRGIYEYSEEIIIPINMRTG